jgi:hypothetical protein
MRFGHEGASQLKVRPEEEDSLQLGSNLTRQADSLGFSA